MNDPPKFMFDECIGLPIMERLAETLSGTYHFEHICSKFISGILDNEWIPQLGAEGGWVVITGDAGRKSKKGSKLPKLCLLCKVTCLILSPKLAQKKTADKFGALLATWDHIVELHAAPPGSQFMLRYRETSKGTLGLSVEPFKSG